MHRKFKPKNYLVILLTCSFIFAFSNLAISNEKPVGKLTYFSGTVLIKSKGSWNAQPSLNHPLYSSDKIVTRLGEAKITFNDGFVVKIGNNSNLSINEQMEKDGLSGTTETVKRRLRLMLGKLSFKTGDAKQKKKTLFETPTAVCALRGTAGTLSVVWKDGQFYEKGSSTFSDGSTYAGEFRDGELYNDQGTLIFSDGSKYVGEWKNGKRHGHGVMTLPNGEILEGEFKNDKFVGK